MKEKLIAEQEDQQHGKSFIQSFAYWVAIGFGSGLASKAPGTAGTLVAIPIYLALDRLDLWQYLVVVFVLLIAGFWLCDTAAKQLGVHDDPSIVWDEIVGYLITMIAAPGGWFWVISGFVLFRLFDILKPWPIRTIDRKVKGGLGIMMDDVLAALFALVILQTVYWVLPQ